MRNFVVTIAGLTSLLTLAACTHGSSGASTVTTTSVTVTSTANTTTTDATSSTSDVPVVVDTYFGADGVYYIYQDPDGDTYEEGPTGTDLAIMNLGYGYQSLDMNNTDGTPVIYTYGSDIYSKEQQSPVDFRVQQARAVSQAVAKAAGNIRPHVNDLKTAIKVAKVAVQVQAAGGFQNADNVDAAVKNLVGTSLTSITQELLTNGPNSDGINQMAAVANQNGFGHTPEEAKQLVLDLMAADFKFSGMSK